MHSLHFEAPFYTTFEIIKYQYFLINPRKLFVTHVYLKEIFDQNVHAYTSKKIFLIQILIYNA